ncbi:hypothetical protein RJ639_001397 [Escallonia herrerae]|uniref:ArsA/GET3 Anion-transporting ATPase-like domain-containing protein n=1 Tax=Escallonia herrerae TaxID=1293975 RepID=A0AA89BGC9_9ASTE|nr:hypothetical protein RJ639_001397 [Escallonia herrerae]
MASSALPLRVPSPFLRTDIHPYSHVTFGTSRRKDLAVILASSVQESNVLAPSKQPTRLVTFLGKGGSGKTTSAVFAAQMLLEPLNRLKQADASLNMTQGVLEGVVGEELGVLPGMDSIFSVLALERLVGFSGNVSPRNNQKEKFDVVVYDGTSSEETIRMIGATSKARLYLKYMRNLAERTDLGRVASPSLLRLVDEAIGSSSRRSLLNGKLSAEIWDDLEQMLERGSTALAEPRRLGCYLIMDPNSTISLNSALRYWGCAIQAGVQVSGAFGTAVPNSSVESAGRIKNNFSPLPFASVPHVIMGNALGWNEIMLTVRSKDARDLLTAQTSDITNSVKFNPANKSVTLLMPGFDKSEIKLFQVLALHHASKG